MYYPVKYFDPTGHNPQCGPDGVWCSDNFEEKYGINFQGRWSLRDKAAVRSGVIGVAYKLSITLGLDNPAMAFALVYGYIKFEMGNCDQCDPGSDVAAYTYSAHEIRFTGLSNWSGLSGNIRRRNHVVHELGHAFKWALHSKSEIDVYSELGQYRISHPDFPDRETFDGPSLTTGPFDGFASRQNQTSWQVSLEGSDSEEFADQFLGWTFNKWETNLSGSLTTDARARSNMMNNSMPTWVELAAGIRK